MLDLSLESKPSFHACHLCPTKPYKLSREKGWGNGSSTSRRRRNGKGQASKANVYVTKNVMMHLFVQYFFEKIENKARHGGRNL